MNSSWHLYYDEKGLPTWVNKNIIDPNLALTNSSSQANNGDCHPATYMHSQAESSYIGDNGDMLKPLLPQTGNELTSHDSIGSTACSVQGSDSSSNDSEFDEFIESESGREAFQSEVLNLNYRINKIISKKYEGGGYLSSIMSDIQQILTSRWPERKKIDATNELESKNINAILHVSTGPHRRMLNDRMSEAFEIKSSLSSDSFSSLSSDDSDIPKMTRPLLPELLCCFKCNFNTASCMCPCIRNIWSVIYCA